MKTLYLILIIIALVLYISGTIWYYLDKKSEGHKKAPMIIKAIGSFLMAIYFIIILIRGLI